MQDLTVAIVQTNQFWEDKEANYAHLEACHLTKITPGACDLVVLPEMFNTGFTMNAAEMAEEMSGRAVRWLQKWAKELDCEMVASLIIKEEKAFYNRLLVVSKTGIQAMYDKRHLFRMAGEQEIYTPGARRVTYQLNGWTILLQVCYDLRFPVFSRNRNRDGKPEYDLVLYVANWPEKRSSIWSVLLQARAIENQAFCLGVNRVGTDGKEISYSGDSALVDPWGNVAARLTKNEEQVKILTLSSGELAAVRANFPAFRDADTFDLPFNQDL